MFNITILGNNSAVQAYGRNPTSQFLQAGPLGLLIDCGEGTQNQMSRYKVKPGKLTHIFISHLHGDHYFGLIGLLTSMSLMGRIPDLHLYGPKALIDVINLQLAVAESSLNFPLHFHPLEKEEILLESENLEVSCFKVNHKIECWGFLFQEKKKKRSLDISKAMSFGIPPSFYNNLQNGEDYVHPKGTIIPNEELTVAAPTPRSYAFCADTIFDRSLIEKIKGVDLLYHETTYLKDHEDKASLRYHSTTHQAATIALEADVKQLMIGHFSSKYESIQPFLEEAREVFGNTILAVEGSCVKIG